MSILNMFSTVISQKIENCEGGIILHAVLSYTQVNVVNTAQASVAIVRPLVPYFLAINSVRN
jgi:hypothetical protein